MPPAVLSLCLAVSAVARPSVPRIEPPIQPTEGATDVIFSLVRPGEIPLLVERSQCLFRSLPAATPYDSVVFHTGDISESEMAYAKTTLSNTRFIDARRYGAFVVPFNVTLPKDSGGNVIDDPRNELHSISYRHMVRAYSALALCDASSCHDIPPVDDRCRQPFATPACA